MAGDSRDWYRDWWRKRDGYVEQAKFRVPLDESKPPERPADPARRTFYVAVTIAALVGLRAAWKRAKRR